MHLLTTNAIYNMTRNLTFENFNQEEDMLLQHLLASPASGPQMGAGGGPRSFQPSFQPRASATAAAMAEAAAVAHRTAEALRQKTREREEERARNLEMIAQKERQVRESAQAAREEDARKRGMFACTACIYVCMYIRLCMCVYECMCVCTKRDRCLRRLKWRGRRMLGRGVCLHALYVRMCVYVCVCMRVCMHVRVYAQTRGKLARVLKQRGKRRLEEGYVCVYVCV